MLAVVWISLPNLSSHLFAKKYMFSIASKVVKLIAIDKAIQIKSIPSTTRLKVILDIMKKLSNCIRLQFVNGKSGKLIELFKDIVYDKLSSYCNYSKHQGHDEDICRLISKKIKITNKLLIPLKLLQKVPSIVKSIKRNTKSKNKDCRCLSK